MPDLIDPMTFEGFPTEMRKQFMAQWPSVRADWLAALSSRTDAEIDELVLGIFMLGASQGVRWAQIPPEEW